MSWVRPWLWSWLLLLLGFRCQEPPEPPPEPVSTGGLPSVDGGSAGAAAAGSGAAGGGPQPTCDWKPARAARAVLRLGARVVGGSNAPPGLADWAASVQTPYGSHVCSGTLIDPQVVQTAAHCATMPGDRIVVGRVDLRTDAGQVRKVVQARVPSRYSSVDKGWDVALLVLAEPVEGIEHVQLPEEGQSFDGLRATIFGWGAIKEGGPAHPVLQMAEVPLWPREECLAAYLYMPETAFCAGYQEGGIDTCQGDSGGPIAVLLSSGWVTLGGTSYGAGCARPGAPGVYFDGTRSETLGWIRACLQEVTA